MKILVVDDDADIRTMMRAMFARRGWETTEAASAREALHYLDQDPPLDAIVLDYRMPDITGIELARNLREAGLTPRVVMCSAYLNPAIEKEAEELGVPTVDKADFAQLAEVIGRSAED